MARSSFLCLLATLLAVLSFLPTSAFADEPVPPALVETPDALPTPVDGGARVRHNLSPTLYWQSPNYIGFRGVYLYEAWLKSRWALVGFGRFEIEGGGHSTVQDIRLWVEFGPQLCLTNGTSTLTQQLRAGFWGDAFPAQGSPSISYVFDGDIAKILDLYGLVSWRPTVTTENEFFSEGSTGLWFGEKSVFRTAFAWDTELGIGPRVDFRVKSVRFNAAFLIANDVAVVGGADWQF